MTGLGVESARDLFEHGAKRVHGDLTFLLMQDFDETRHVGALEVMRQVHIHVEISNGVLVMTGSVSNTHWMDNIFYAHFIDRELTMVFPTLHVLDRSRRADAVSESFIYGHVHTNLKYQMLYGGARCASAGLPAKGRLLRRQPPSTNGAFNASAVKTRIHQIIQS